MDDLYLKHHGILGQKWGVRRYQNSDGSLTSEGKKRYSNQSGSKEKFHLTDNQKTALKIGVAVAGTALAAYGAYHISTVAKVNNAFDKELTKKLLREAEIYADPRLNLTTLSPSEFASKNFKMVKSDPENRKLIEKLIADQKNVDLINAKNNIRYGYYQFRAFLGDRYAAMRSKPYHFTSDAEEGLFTPRLHDLIRK